MNDSRQRDSMGRFIDGHTNISPGRKPRAVEQEYLATMEQIVSGDVWERIVQQAAVDAQLGDSKARVWLSAYLLGMPISRTQEVEESNAMDESVQRVIDGMRADAQASGDHTNGAE